MTMISILWVDDDPNYLHEYLEKDVSIACNATIDYASTVSVAIQKLKQNDYDLILLDAQILSIHDFHFISKEFNDEKIMKERDWTNLFPGIRLLKLLRAGSLSIIFNKVYLTHIPIIISSHASQRSLLEQISDGEIKNTFIIPKNSNQIINQIKEVKLRSKR